jgi:hypothetical protein
MRPALPKEWKNDPLLRHLLRHVVAIYFDFRRKDAEPIQVVYTTFLFSIHDCWMLMTAGHGITKIANYRNAGYELHGCSLLDSLGTDAKHFEPIEFNYESMDPQVPSREISWDYGILFPTANHRQLLEKNGVVPLTLQWKDGEKPLQIQEYKLLGLPKQMIVKTAPNRATLVPMLVRLDSLNERPDGFCDTDAPMFYGQLPSSWPLTEMAGMSGGPIFAFAPVNDRVRYWLHAMQVSWVRGTPYVSGMLMEPFCQFLKDAIEGKYAPPEPGDGTE